MDLFFFAIPIGTNCPHLLIDFLLYSRMKRNSSSCMRFSGKKRKEASLVFKFGVLLYIWCPFNVYNYRLGYCVDPIYPIKLAKTDTTYTARYVSYFDLRLEIDHNISFICMVFLHVSSQVSSFLKIRIALHASCVLYNSFWLDGENLSSNDLISSSKYCLVFKGKFPNTEEIQPGTNLFLYLSNY